MDKVKQSIDLIRQYAPYADKFGGYKVAFSGGKDSQVMLDLFRRAGVRYAAHYNVTTNDPPENVYFIKKNYPDVEFVLHKLNFYQLILKKKALPTRKMRFCCSYFKEGTGTGFVAVGVRREESVKRAKYPTIAFYKRDDDFDADKIREGDRVIFRPILEWREDEIWQYIEDNNIPVNPCYETAGRVGCMFCPFARKKTLYYNASKYPKFHALLLKTIRQLLDNGYCNKYQPLTPEEVFEWWASKEPASLFFNQLKLDLQ